ncbi:MAG: SPASM domain-containing protein [Clostridiales Family XIII bacterium]|jgi:uncharacterized protein|nr:SPASM domain-containing protein [Clostridiales Family XIII bacterium]
MIHLYRYNDNNIAMDVESGAIHVLSDTAATLLARALEFEAADRAEEAFLAEHPEFNSDDNHESCPIHGAGAAESADAIATEAGAAKDALADMLIASTQEIDLEIGEDGKLCEGCAHEEPEYYEELIIRAVNDLLDTDDDSSPYGIPLNQLNSDELLESTNDLVELISNDALFTQDDFDDSLVTDRDAVIKAMCLHVAHDCNMACKYCFGDTGAFCGDRSLMSLETGKKAIDFLLQQSGNRRNLELDFFGGEPLMNFEVVKQLVAYGREQEKLYIIGANGTPDIGNKNATSQPHKHIRFTITTNGLLLDDDKIDFINEHMDNVILSIDGRPDVNDRMRPTPNGKGTYDIIIENFIRFKNKRENNPDITKRLYYVRGTFTKYNLDFAEDVRHLADIGFDKVSVEPVVTDADKPYAISDEDLPVILAEYDKLAEIFLEYEKKGEPWSFFHFNISLDHGPCAIKRVSGCGAGTEYVAISPEGDIYPCHQFVGENDYKLGNLHDITASQPFTNRLYDFFNSAHIGNKEACGECFAKYYCSGGCHANALHQNDDICKPYAIGCELEKKRIECAIGIKASQ